MQPVAPDMEGRTEGLSGARSVSSLEFHADQTPVTSSLISTVSGLLRSLPRRRKLQLVSLFALMVVAAVTEVVSLGAVVPFLTVLAEPAVIMEKFGRSEYTRWLDIGSASQIRLQLTAVFVIAILVSGLVRLLLAHLTARVNYGIGHDFGVETYRRTLLQPYSVHVARNSSEIISGVTKVDEVVLTVFALLMTFSSLLIAVCILAALLWIDFRVAAGVILAFGLIYGISAFLTRRTLSLNGQLINQAYGQRIQAVQEGLGGIRDVILDNTQHIFLKRFAVTDQTMREAQATNRIIGPLPRFIIETAGVVSIALLAYALTSNGDGFASAVPVLGALAMGAQRLIPLLQQAYQGWATTAGNRHVLVDVLHLLEQPIVDGTDGPGERMAFEREIRCANVSFRYQEETAMVLDQINLAIANGARVGFIGATGSGKSTLMDLLMGMMPATGGSISIDGVELDSSSSRGWQRRIAHVPQAIYLADASFAENIAFGTPHQEIDMERVRRAAGRAQIADFIEASPMGYKAFVGERGIRLSGGQRQRVGLARALYKEADVLVFDEATSALDPETEEAVIEAISGLGRELTILMIAHRLTTLRSCDVIYRLQNGGVVEVGSYAEIQSSILTKKDHA